jgi:hypothetical protein
MTVMEIGGDRKLDGWKGDWISLFAFAVVCSSKRKRGKSKDCFLKNQYFFKDFLITS